MQIKRCVKFRVWGIKSTNKSHKATVTCTRSSSAATVTCTVAIVSLYKLPLTSTVTVRMELQRKHIGWAN